jgi:hypothetical protein
MKEGRKEGTSERKSFSVINPSLPYTCISGLAHTRNAGVGIIGKR